MKLLQNYNEDDLLSKILLLYFAFQHGAVGFFFLFSNPTNMQSEYLDGLREIFPMDVWGIVLIVSSLSFVFTILQENKLEYWFMMLAGSTGGLTFSLLAMASLELSIYQTNTINYIIIASIDIIIAIVGGVAVWLRRT